MTKQPLKEVDKQLENLKKRMGINYLWDTNIVIYYLQQQFPPLAGNHIDDLLKISPPTIPVISKIELL